MLGNLYVTLPVQEFVGAAGVLLLGMSLFTWTRRRSTSSRPEVTPAKRPNATPAYLLALTRQIGRQ